jgi:hypothetical protein
MLRSCPPDVHWSDMAASGPGGKAETDRLEGDGTDFVRFLEGVFEPPVPFMQAAPFCFHLAVPSALRSDTLYIMKAT